MSDCSFSLKIAGGEAVVVRNLKYNLLKAEAASSEGIAVNQNSSTPQKTKVGVLISGTGECPVTAFTVELFFWHS